MEEIKTMPLPFPRAVLFDLDGTLADTAPDLAGAMNRVRTAKGLPPTPYETLRPVASAGARGLIGASFGLKPEDEGFDELRTAFLDAYAASIAVESRLFDGMDALLAALIEKDIAWGIVTNKAGRFTHLLVPELNLQHAGCVIAGDTTPYSKPHPEPLLEAARRLNILPEQCWYVGDDLRDIQAGRAAGMTTIAAAWGYCGHQEPVEWLADAIAATPLEVLGLIQSSS